MWRELLTLLKERELSFVEIIKIGFLILLNFLEKLQQDGGLQSFFSQLECQRGKRINLFMTTGTSVIGIYIVNELYWRCNLQFRVMEAIYGGGKPSFNIVQARIRAMYRLVTLWIRNYTYSGPRLVCSERVNPVIIQSYVCLVEFNDPQLLVYFF